MSFDEVWTKAALADIGEVPVAGRDQIEALVREICRDPRAVGRPDLSGAGASHAEDRVAVAGPAVVFYRVIDAEDKIVYIARVRWRT